MAKTKKKEKIEYYTLDKILATNSQYNIIYGQRSNGKTFSVQLYGLKNYIEKGEQMAIIRRYELDFTGKRGQETFTHLMNNAETGNLVEKLSNGQWNGISYFASRWYLYKLDEKGEKIRDAQPFCYAFSLANVEHDKSTSYPNVTTVLFDEFMSRQYYLPDEFISFTNTLSTIIRQRDNVKIFMLGNTVNKYNPYFKEMGLENILDLKQGELKVYKFAVYDDKELRIAVEYAENQNKKGKPSDVYFAFNNPKLKMITNGLWELAVYPHLPYKYTKNDIIGEYFMEWEEALLHCEIISNDDGLFTYIHEKTTPIKNEALDIVFSPNYNPRYNYRRKITQPIDEAGKKIYWFFKNEKVFYQDNEVGEVVRNYLNWCKTDKGFI